MEEILRVENIEKYYGKKGLINKVLDNISFYVDKGEYVGIMGASGAGKTTLLNCISTIDSVTSGNIYISGENITNMTSKEIAKFRREKLGFIFQEFNLLDNLTGYENIALSLSISKTKNTDVEAKIIQVSKDLNLNEIMYKYPYEMSGGQKQKIAAARAIVTDPSLILADEPTGSLDSKSARGLLDILKKLNTEFEATILMVTHDAYTASHCNRILFIKDGSIFNELDRGNDTQKEFFNKIIEVIALLGGNLDVE
ncbi:MAG: ABC transporter ATP-binding protein [Proteocatella sp.]